MLRGLRKGAHQAFLWSRYYRILLDLNARLKFCSRILNEFSQDIPLDALGSFAGGCLCRSILDEVRHMSDIVSRSHESFGCSILKCKAVVCTLDRPYFSCEQPSQIDNRAMGLNGRSWLWKVTRFGRPQLLNAKSSYSYTGDPSGDLIVVNPLSAFL